MPQAAPTSQTVIEQVPGPTYTPAPTYTPLAPLPTYTPAPVSTVLSIRQITRVHNVTHVHNVTRYHDVTRTHTRVVTHVVVKTLVKVRYVTKVRVLTHVRTIVNHKVVVQTKVHEVQAVHVVTKVVYQHKTIVKTITKIHIVQQPGTGRFAATYQAPARRSSTTRAARNLPPVEARLSIARLGIHWAPLWARDFIANPDGSLRYDIVSSYGATRFSASARYGQAGLSMVSGHDDIAGSIFRYLGMLKPGDDIQV